jgi:hypothetical protein
MSQGLAERAVGVELRDAIRPEWMGFGIRR